MLPAFELEEYLLAHESRATISLCASSLETVSLSRLLSLADEETRALWDGLVLDYSQPQGLPMLKAEISQQYKAILPESVCIFAGAAEAIMCTLQGLLTTDDHAIVVTPCYQSLETIPASLCEVTSISLDEADGWSLRLDAVEAAVRPNTKLIVINFPNNPTGALPDWPTLAALIELARRHNLYLFSDEVYRGMEIDPADRLPAIADCYERGISICSISKPYGLPGLRVGWVASQDASVIDAATAVKHYMSICPNSTGEVLALMALRAQTQILDKNLSIMRRNLRHIDQFFAQHCDLFKWQIPKGGCIGFPQLLSSESAGQFAERLLQEEGVLILPGHVYRWGNHHFRISYGKANMSDALTRFQQCLISMPV